MKITCPELAFIPLILMAMLPFFSLDCTGQSEFLPQGMSGLGVDAGYSWNQDSEGIGADVGFSIRGRVDLVFGLSGLSTTDNDPDADLKAFVLSPGLVLHVLRQSEVNFLAICGILLYSHATYAGGNLNPFLAVPTSSTWHFGLGFYHRFDVGEIIAIVPSIDVLYNTTELKIPISYIKTQVEKDEYAQAQVSLSVMIKEPHDRSFQIVPAFGISNNQKVYGISIGFVTPINIQ